MTVIQSHCTNHIKYVQIFPFPAKPSSSSAAKEKSSDPPLESIWVVEMSETQIFKWDAGKEVTYTSVGAFSSKATAIENARVALTNMDNCEGLFGPDGVMDDENEMWEDVEDNSGTVGDDGGALFKVGGYRVEYAFSIKKVGLNKPIEKKKSY